jgi:hypothetical protein
LVADRRVPAAGCGHRHRRRLVTRAGGCPHPDHPGPLPAPAAPTAGPPLGHPWPAPPGRRRGLPPVGLGQRGTRRGRKRCLRAENSDRGVGRLPVVGLATDLCRRGQRDDLVERTAEHSFVHDEAMRVLARPGPLPHVVADGRGQFERLLLVSGRHGRVSADHPLDEHTSLAEPAADDARITCAGASVQGQGAVEVSAPCGTATRCRPDARVYELLLDIAGKTGKFLPRTLFVGSPTALDCLPACADTEWASVRVLNHHKHSRHERRALCEPGRVRRSGADLSASRVGPREQLCHVIEPVFVGRDAS